MSKSKIIRQLLSGEQSTSEASACCMCGSTEELLIDHGTTKCGSCFRKSLVQYGYRGSEGVVRWHPQAAKKRG
jgi:hypothetical protein